MLTKDSTFTLNNGVQMPVIGLGVFDIADTQIPICIATAVEAGYRMFDTAKAYGNEATLGQALRESGVARAEFFVVTKLWNEDIRTHTTCDAFSRSLERLGLDAVDLYLIHWPVEGFEDAWLEMEKLYEQKLVRAIGLSNFAVVQLQSLEQVQSVVPAVNQVEFHPWRTRKEWLEYADKQDIRIQAHSPFMHGGEVLSDSVITQLAEKY